MKEAMLNVTEGPLAGQALPIRYRDLKIGRSKECKIRPSDEGYDELSREHARLYWDGAAFVIEDLHSQNGILVDGKTVQSARLRDGSVVQLGDFHGVLAVPAGGPEFADTRQSRSSVSEMLKIKIAEAQRSTKLAIGAVMAVLFVTILYSMIHPATTVSTSTIKRVENATVLIEWKTETGTRQVGTGFLVEGNRVVTARHCAAQYEEQANGTWANITPVPCTVVFFAGTDHEKAVDVSIGQMSFLPPGVDAATTFRTDLALLKLPESAPEGATTLELADSRNLVQGQSVTIVGFPAMKLGQIFSGSDKLPTTSTLFERVQRIVPDTGDPYEVQLGTSQKGGNSGGPIIDNEGRVVAVVEGGLEREKVALFATDIPSNQVQKLLDESK